MTTETLDNAAPERKDAQEETKLNEEITPVTVPADNAGEETEVQQTTTAAEPLSVAEEAPVEDETVHRMTKEEILSRIKEIAADVENSSKAEIDLLKQVFYKLHNVEIENARKAFIEAGNSADAFVPASDPDEEEFKKVMAVIKEKRNEINASLEKQKEENYQVKLTIIEELKDLIDSPDDPNKNYQEFKRLQQQWNEITLVPQSKVNELWKNYQINVEKFYDLLKLNNEFRDYDFKKNLEIKTRLCEEAEKLSQDPDVVSAFHQLQKLHQEYRDTGPVAKDKREEMWNRFKAASAVINRNHQQHFEELKKSEQDNLDKKTVICEIIEAIDYAELTTYKQWDNKTKEVISLQEKWKTIGFAPQKMNAKIFGRFRKACDEFFNRKAEFYKATKTKMDENLSLKRALCEKAEALKDSTDWKATADELAKLQKEWKTIGPVAKKYSDQIWQRFIKACDSFFEQRKKATSSQRDAEVDNLKRKKEIIEKLKALATEAGEDLQQKISELQKEWNETGHVPFKDKDKIYSKYRSLVDDLYSSINSERTSRRLNKFRSSISNLQSDGAQSVSRERDRLVRLCENLTNELHTYENNLGFLNAASKSGNSILNELHRKMDKLRDEIQLAKDKIKAIDNGGNAPAATDKPAAKDNSDTETSNNA